MNAAQWGGRINFNFNSTLNQYNYPDGNCNAFKFQPNLQSASDNRNISKSVDPSAMTVVAGRPYTKIPPICRKFVSIYFVVSSIAFVLAT